MAKRKSQTPQDAAGGQPRLFELRVYLMTSRSIRRYPKGNRAVSRTILIRGDQTLEDLHEAIFTAFDRYDEHMYEFQIGGTKAHDPKARRYAMGMAIADDFGGSSPVASVEETRIGALGMRKDRSFLYWFDFGDDWWHQIDVAAIHDEIPAGEYPKITDRRGASPPQYPDAEEE